MIQAVGIKERVYIGTRLVVVHGSMVQVVHLHVAYFVPYD
jgi:hypothetical protein